MAADKKPCDICKTAKEMAMKGDDFAWCWCPQFAKWNRRHKAKEAAATNRQQPKPETLGQCIIGGGHSFNKKGKCIYCDAVSK